MSKRKSKEIIESDQEGSGDEFVEEETPKVTTNNKSSKPKKQKQKKSFDSDYEEGDRGETADGETYFKLDQKRRVTVRKFKSMILVDIREYFDTSDGMKPTKKGVSLPIDQWNKLKEFVEDIDQEVKKLKKVKIANLRVQKFQVFAPLEKRILELVSLVSLEVSLPSLSLFNQAIIHAKTQKNTKPAIIDTNTGTSHIYIKLVQDVAAFKNEILQTGSKEAFKTDLKEERVASLFPNGYDYVVSQWSIWAAGGIAVPMSPLYSNPELLYTIQDSQASIIIAHSNFENRIKEITDQTGINNLPSIFPMDEARRAMIIYTSGTTGKPKGVVLTHANLKAQIKSLVEMWRITDRDRILHVLPLHHIHGSIFALACLLYSGATVEMFPKFDATSVWNRFMRPERDLTIFMAVPTMIIERWTTEKIKFGPPSIISKFSSSLFYLRKLMSINYLAKLTEQYYKMPAEMQKIATDSCSQFRVMISGSSALPSSLRSTWEEISGGQVLLERYGLSEIGIGLSGGYEVEKRIEGCVGLPVPGVQVRLISEDDKDVTDEIEEPGEIQIKGENVFKGYWNRPETTENEFTKDGWFKTGDIAVCTNNNIFKILGRKSVDIIKSGGYKISALEIERELLSHPEIIDTVVVGVDDPIWGQSVGAIIVTKDQNTKITLDQLRKFLSKRLASYKIPRLLNNFQGEFPRSPIGKVNKKELAKIVFPSGGDK
ncbi:11377_t:CDS:10 [Ambispora gerdemannii]|uniref:11377_t:CDS:1 n=1 Tax=Ambispora gerdemannii TaxID=144530 RepID=A0A9N9CYZ9_9GLOM|nr:11377_t:CDS:10 [Ambispora gerdemannii]